MVGDLVLRLKQDGHGKLESPWPGPYVVKEVIPGGAYRLHDKKIGKDEGNPWNTEQLRWFYAKKWEQKSIGFSAHASKLMFFYYRVRTL
jgi:hypothetical protein